MFASTAYIFTDIISNLFSNSLILFCGTTRTILAGLLLGLALIASVYLEVFVSFFGAPLAFQVNLNDVPSSYFLSVSYSAVFPLTYFFCSSSVMSSPLLDVPLTVSDVMSSATSSGWYILPFFGGSILLPWNSNSTSFV